MEKMFGKKIGSGSYGVILESNIKKNQGVGVGGGGIKVFKILAPEKAENFYDEPKFYPKKKQDMDKTTFASVDFLRELYWCFDPKMANCSVQAKSVIYIASENKWGLEMDKATCNMLELICEIHSSTHSPFKFYYDPTISKFQVMIDIASQLINIVEEMDRVAGLAHFDLKPGNVLYFKESNSLLLCDGGSSRLGVEKYKENTITSILTTLLYRSPEMHAKKRFGKPSDIWSLGCILYELFSGRIMFYADSDETLTRLYESENIFVDPSVFGVISLTNSIPFYKVNVLKKDEMAMDEMEDDKLRKEKERHQNKRIRLDLETRIRLDLETRTLLERRMKYIDEDLPCRDLIQHIILACLQVNPDHRPKIGQLKYIFDWISSFTLI